MFLTKQIPKRLNLASVLRNNPLKTPYPLYRRQYATVKTDNIDWNPMRSNKQLAFVKKSGESETPRNIVFIILCLTPIVTFGLGCWQLSRLKWKNQLVAECEDRLTYAPSPLPKSITGDQVKDFEYRKVLIHGHFDYSREIFVGPRLHDDQKGYLLVCPFIQSNGSGELLVDRGWIAEDKVIPESRNLQHLSCPKGEITVECLLRVPPTKGMFHFDHEEGSRLFHYVDLEAMAMETGSRAIYAQVVEDFRDRPDWLQSTENYNKQQEANLAEPVKSSSSLLKFWSRDSDKKDDSVTVKDQGSISQVSDEKMNESLEFNPLQFVNAGVPLGKVPKIDYKNNHMNYLVTWFGLSFASAILLFMTIKKGKLQSAKGEKLRHARKFLG